MLRLVLIVFLIWTCPVWLPFLFGIMMWILLIGFALWSWAIDTMNIPTDPPENPGVICEIDEYGNNPC